MTTRNRVSDPRNRPWDKRMRNWLVELLAKLPVTPRLLNLVLHLKPGLAPLLIESAMKALVKDRYDEVSYKVFNIGNANLVPAYSSMMHGQDTMMMELIQLRGNEGGYEMLGAYEDALYALGGRPHWGQVNTLTGSHGLVASMYPRYEDWQAVHRQMNSTGVFDSPFSKRVGIAEDRFTA